MNDYKAVRSGLEISQRAASYLELSDPAALRQKTLAGTIYAINGGRNVLGLGSV